MEPAVLQDGVQSPVAWYREFLPCEALRADVFALFSFVPGAAATARSRPLLRKVAFRHATVCAPQFADGQVSIRFELGKTCDAEGSWRADSHALGASHFFGIPVSDLTDVAVALGDIWGERSARLSAGLAGRDEPYDCLYDAQPID